MLQQALARKFYILDSYPGEGSLSIRMDARNVHNTSLSELGHRMVLAAAYVATIMIAVFFVLP